MAATTPTLAPVPGPPPGIAPPPPSVGADSPLFEGLAARIADRSAVVAVVGLGYVGLPLLEASARQGYRLVGVDIDATKVRSLRRGRSYLSDVADGDLDALAHARFSTDHRVLIAADVVVVAVPTPLRDGRPDLSAVRSAASAISEVLRPGQLVVLESTTYPGTTEEVVRPLLEESGFVSSRDFALAYSPERIDPGSDRSLRHTPKLVAGVGRADTEVAARFYETLVDEVVRLSSPRAAEMAKLVENTFRHVNIALGNELATIAPALGVDIWEALDAAATKPFGYLPFWPGPGVGGHCIAVDPSYLSWQVEQRLGFGVGFIEHARAVNNRMPAHVAAGVGAALNGVGKALRGSKVVVLGLTYKPGVNDVRESPAVAVLGHLLDAGAECSYHDPYVPSVQGLASVPLDHDLLATADCVVILTAHQDVDYHAVVDAAPLVFDAVGATRRRRAAHVVLL